MNGTQLTTPIYPPPMNQPDMANATGPQEDVTPPPPHLEKGPEGWSGIGEHWRVVGNVIKIKKSDADASHIPSVGQRQGSVDEDGIFSKYEEITKSDDHIYQLWMGKIGPYLADWVLGKPQYASPKWKLMKFPENYTLWIHKKGVDTDPANPRTDAYLHGAPHLGPHNPRSHSTQLNPTVFRSPMEFVPHAIWLMKGGGDTSGERCRCKYCEPGQNQTEINYRLNHEVVVPDSGGDDDDDSAAGGRDPVLASLASRRSIAGARRGRRTGKRERSPPIKAKDYRVGNPGTGPGPSSAT